MPDSNETAKDRLKATVELLDDQACEVMQSFAEALCMDVIEQICDDSDLICKEFADNFRTRLQLHHAVTSEPLKKKTFEYAFQEASKAAKRKATITSSGTHPGHDITVDGVKISLKTEASRSISVDKITISKFQEARWIRECKTSRDFLAGCRTIQTHLAHYERIFTLRAFRISDPRSVIRYDLVEIPHELLSATSKLQAKVFATRSAKSGGSSAVVSIDGERAFRLVLDGSVEKVTISGINTNLCKLHASWTIPVLVESED